MNIVKPLRERAVMWVWKHTPNCAEISRLASQSFEQPLPIGTRFKMWLHKLICLWCKRYLKHLEFLHAAAPRLDEHAEVLGSSGLSADAKLRIVQTLQSAARRA
jgi:hypothetical protein